MQPSSRQDSERDIPVPAHGRPELAPLEPLLSLVYLFLPAGAARGELLGDEKPDQSSMDDLNLRPPTGRWTVFGGRPFGP